MSEVVKKGALIDSGLCRCCGKTKRCRVLTDEYTFEGQKEIYSEMFIHTFGLLLLNLEANQSSRLICASCVCLLRTAASFKCQVMRCEADLLNTVIHNEEPELPAAVKQEPERDRSDGGGDSDRDDNDTIESPPSPPSKRTRAAKTITSKRKRHKEKQKEREEMDRMALEEQMRQTEEVMKQTEIGEHDPPKKEPDTSELKIKNAIILIENSYICPFDSSFSDFLCFYCKELHTDAEKLREHTLTHDPTTLTTNSINKKRIHADITRIDCRLCPQTIDNVNELKNHLIQNHGKNFHDTTNDFVDYKLTNKNLMCSQCGRRFKFFHALKLHMAEHYGNCICDVCGIHFYEERVLYLHLRTHNKSDRTFLCSDCGRPFKSKHSRDAHVSNFHRKEPTYECHTCPRVFLSYARRLRHYADDHGLARLASCDHCDKVYDSRKSLREHIRRTHAKVFKHQCDLCDKRFYLPCRLREHLVTHSGERNFRCDFCGKTYPRLRSLKVHMQTHVSDKRFKCSLCAAAFTQNVNLRNHVRKQHQTDLPETI